MRIEALCLEEWAQEKIKRIFPWPRPDVLATKEEHFVSAAYLSNFLDGKWVGPKYHYKPVINPLNGEPFIFMPDTTEQELEPFIESLKRCPRYGLHNPLYNTDRYAMYGEICFKAARFLSTKTGRDYFAKLIQLVMPKDMEQCYAEVDVVTRFLKTFSGNQVRFLACGRITPGDHAGQEAMDYRYPRGLVAIISVFNFPLEIVALQLLGALFMGNKVILKPASLTGIVAEAFVRLLLDCGMPKEDMLLIHCRGEVMEKLVANEVIQFVQFTGDSKTAKRLKKIVAGEIRWEDSGYNWKILGPNPIPSMVDLVAEHCDMDTGAISAQKCSAERLLLIHENWEPDAFIMKLEKLAQKRNLKDLTISPVLTWTNQEIQEHIEKLLKIPGAKLLFGGKPISEKHSIPECYGSWQHTAVYVPLDQILPNFDLVTIEVFGPVRLITTWEDKDLDLILEIIERIGPRLTAGIVDSNPGFLDYMRGRTTNGTRYIGLIKITGAPEWRYFGPTGGNSSGIGTAYAIIDTWSQNVTDTRDSWGYWIP